MIDPSKLSLKARLADKAAGRPDPAHLQPILYQQRVRELLDSTVPPTPASEVAVRTGQLTVPVYPEATVPAYVPLSAPFVLEAVDEPRSHWTSFGLGMASGVVCGWALLVIVVATVTSFGPQPTNAAMHPGEARPAEGLEQHGRDLAGAVALPLATEYLTQVHSPGSGRMPAKERATGDFAVVPASVIASIGGWDGEKNATPFTLRAGAVNADKTQDEKLQAVSADVTEDRPARHGSVDHGNSGLSGPSRTKADDVSVAALPRGGVRAAQSRVKHAADGPTTEVAPKTVAPVRRDRKASPSKSRKSRVARAASKTRRSGKKLVRNGPANRRRSAAALQRRAGRSSAGLLAVRPTKAAKPPSFLASTGLLKAQPPWARKLFSTARSEP